MSQKRERVLLSFLDISITLAAVTLTRKTKKIQLKCRNFNENIHSQRLLQSVVHGDIADKLNKSEAYFTKLRKINIRILSYVS